MAFRFESLKIWHSARSYAGTIYNLTARMPRSEDYGLRSQLNRAVNSVSLNIAEGSGRSTDKSFDAFLSIAVASSFEVVAALFLALDRGYITAAEHQAAYEEGEQLAKSINAFRKSLVRQ